jgi:hypothetical protein
VKQFVLVLVISAALSAGLALPALSQNTDTLEVMVSPQVVLSVSIEQANVSHGSLPLSPSDGNRSTNASPTLKVTNGGNAPANLLIRGSDATTTSGNTWTLSCLPDGALGTVALDQYAYRYFVLPDTIANAQAMCSASDKTLASSVAAGTFVEFRLQMNMPTATTGFGERTSTVTITAVQP